MEKLFGLKTKEEAMMYQTSLFSKFARKISREAGHPLAFLSAMGLILLWLFTGPFFRFSDASGGDQHDHPIVTFCHVKHPKPR